MSSPDDVMVHAVQTQPTNEEYDLHKMKSALLLPLFFQKHKNQKIQKREYAWIYNILYVDGPENLLYV